jgi:hypothetical protein
VLQGMWLVLLESAKDQFLGVDPPKQLVPPCVWYGMTCLLNRDVIGSVSCSMSWERALCLAWDPHGARGVQSRGNLSTASGAGVS